MTSEESEKQSTRALASGEPEKHPGAPVQLRDDPPAVKPSFVWMIVPVLVIIVAMYLAR